MKNMEYEVIPLGEYEANCTVVWGKEKKAWIFDPGGDAEVLLAFLKEKGLEPSRVLLTHAHFDHIGAIPALLAAHPGLPVHVGVGDKPFFGHPFNANPPAYPSVPPPATLAADLAEGMELSADGLMARVLATPGHTPGGVCFYFEGESLLVAGDTLFAGSAGRTDFPGGSARTLYASLARLKALPPETKVVCGHGPSTTIGRELLANPFFC